MTMNIRRSRFCATLVIALTLLVTITSSRLRAESGSCGGATTTLPFTDVPGSNPFFCSIAEAFFSGLTQGTSPTTYSPSADVPREQMAAFITRTMDQALKRGSRRAALKQWWTPASSNDFGMTTVGASPQDVESDGADLWVTNFTSATVSRVRASDGKLLETWTGANQALDALAAKGRIFVTGDTNPGKLYQIDPSQPPGAVTTLTSSLGAFAIGLAFDGARIWTANSGGSVSIVTLNPVGVTTVTTGFSSPFGILYDGANMWVADRGDGKLKKLGVNGAVIQMVTVGTQPRFPVFDGTNIWVPSENTNSLTVVRATTGTVLAVLSGNGLSVPLTAAFDGERILVANFVGPSVSLWKATDLTPIGTIPTGAIPAGVCSDGLNFWITLTGPGKLARF